MEFIDYDWDDIEASFVKEGILGSDFTFSTKSELTHTVDYLPKNQARKLYTYAKEQLDLLKNPVVNIAVETPKVEETPIEIVDEVEEVTAFEEENLNQVQIEEVEEIPTEEVTNFAEIIPATNSTPYDEPKAEIPVSTEKGLGDLSQDELFAKLQNYKKLLDNGLILQGEYDRLKGEILKFL